MQLASYLKVKYSSIDTYFSLVSIIRYFANNGKINVKESYTKFNIACTHLEETVMNVLVGCVRPQYLWELTKFKGLAL